MDAGRAGLTTTGTHGPTPCLLLPEQYAEIKQLGGDIDGRCIPVFDIFPNGGIHYCFPLKDFVHPPVVADMADLQQVRSLFMRDLFTLRTINFPWEECAKCPEALSARCHGGCLAQKKMTVTKKTQSNDYFYQVIPILNPDIMMSSDRGTLALGRFRYELPPLRQNLLAKIDGTRSLGEIFSALEAQFEEKSEVAKREAFFHLVSDLAGAGIVHSRPLNPIEEN
jgi:radical SAM protein with 4Fe4S-binding SPASM domain